MSEVNNYIAFIDLLGITIMAKQDTGQYTNGLEAFKGCVENGCDYLKDKGRVFLFSDCAYLESSDFKSLFKFLISVRHNLMTYGLYFKGAVSKGRLNEMPVGCSDQPLKGSYFGNDVVKVYEAQNALKGVGINVIDFDANIGRYLVQSCYLEHTNSRRAIEFTDMSFRFKFNKDEEITQEDIRDIKKYSTLNNRDYLQSIVMKMFETYSQSKRLARYYLSILISMIQSLEISDLTNKGDKDNRITHPLFSLITSGKMNNFGDLLGIEYLYYAMFNKIISCRVSALDEDKLFTIMARNKKILRSFEYTPRCIFSNESRKNFLRRLGEYKMKDNV